MTIKTVDSFVDSTKLHIKFVAPQRHRDRDFDLAWSNKTVDELSAELLPGHGGYTVTVDKQIAEPGFVPRPGSTVQFTPNFGDIITPIVTWLVASAGVSGAAATGLTVALTAVGYVGTAYLINSLMPDPKGPGPMGGGSPAYSWDPKTTQEEGRVIPRSYGTFRAHGNIIAAYTDVSEDGRKQLIYGLVAFCDGPVEQVLAANVELNGQPYANFSGVTVETRRGLLTQTAMTNFDKTRLQFRVNHKLVYDDGAWTWELPDDDYDDIEITLRFDCWYRHKSGGAGGTGADIKIEIAELDSGSWTTLWDETVNDALTDIKWKKYTVSDEYVMTRGTRYELKFTRGNVDAEADRHHRLLWVESVTEVIDVAFTYPGMVLVSISGVASEEFSGIMDVSALIEKRIVNVYTGSWALAPSDNPAWCLHDIWTLPVISGDGDGTPYAIEEYLGFATARVDSADHYALAQHCDTLVPDAVGGTEKRMTFNGIFDTESTMWKIALRVCEVGRCLPVWSGNVVTLAINKSKSRVDMISVGNILEGSFEECFASRVDAASELEAIFHDAARDYERRALPFHNDNITNEQGKIALDLLGLTKDTEIIRHAKFRLSQTELRQRVLKVRCDIDAMAYEVGDLIGVQEDVVDWGQMGTRGGGRIVGFAAGDSNDVVTIDKDLEDFIEAGETYELVIREHDGSGPTVKTVVSVSGTAVTISGHYAGTAPQKDGLWAMGKQNLVLKDFTIEAIEQSGRLQYGLTLLEYAAACYDTDDEIPVVPIPAATAAKTDRRITGPVSPGDVRRQAAAAGAEFPTIDCPLRQNITWNDNTPGAGSISWSATDGDYPLCVMFDGTVYEIAADDTDKKWIYWDEANPTVFSGTDTVGTAAAPGCWIMAYNDSGTARPTPAGQKIMHAGLLQAASITAALGIIGDLAVDTLQIANNAVTIPSAAFTAGSISLLAAGNYKTIQTLGPITFTGQPVFLFFGCCVDSFLAGFDLRLCLDGTDAGDSIWDSGSTTGMFLAQGMFQDTPSAGSHTYYLRAECSASTNCTNRAIIAIEIKK